MKDNLAHKALVIQFATYSCQFYILTLRGCEKLYVFKIAPHTQKVKEKLFLTQKIKEGYSKNMC